MKNEPIKILYLEHEPNHVERLKVELDKGQYEYKLTHADSGSSFETEIDKAIPDVVLFDHDIPDYDISMAMETLKDHDIDAPFILVTSTLEGEKAVDMIVNYGVSDYILKDNLSRLNPAILREYKNRQIHNQLNEHKKDLEKLSLVASHTNNGVIITDKQGQIEWVNQAFTTITGYTLEESLGKIPGHFLQGEDTSEEKVTQIREKLKEEVSFSEVILNYHKTGYPYWIKLDISPVKDEDGNLNKFIAIQEDVTDRKNAEKKLLKTTQQLTDIVNNLNGVLLRYALHPDGTDDLLYISSGVEQVYGVTQKEALDDVNILFAGVHEDELDEFQRSIQRSAETLRLWDYTWRYISKDGTLKYLQGRGTPTKQDDGTVIWNIFTVDVTEKIVAEQNKKEHQDLLQGSLNEIYIFDASTLKFVYCNDSAAENTQYSEQELKNMTPLDVKKEFTEKELRKTFKKAEQQEGVFFETTHTRKDGSTYNIFVQISQGTYKNKPVYVANILDISERALAEQSYKETNKKLRSLIESAPIGIYLLNTDGVVIDFWNSAGEQIFGYTKEEVMNKFIPYVNDTTKDEALKNLSVAIDGKSISGKRVKRQRKDGKDVIIELHAAPVYKDGEVHQVLILINEVTELVQKESDLKKALNEKDTLIQEIHHRVKNNLAIISGLLQLQILRGADNSQLLDAKNRIHTIASVHEQLYNTDNFSEIDVNKYFSSLILKSKNTFLGPDQEIDINFNSSIDILNINEAVPLGLLVNELITNSVKHAFPNNKGSITMTMNSAPNGMIEFSYSDSGKGFDRAKFEKHEGFGLELINTLISQLTEDFTLKTDGEFSLTFQFNRKLRGAHSNL
jgi:PAS domain S-box-containing protein